MTESNKQRIVKYLVILHSKEMDENDASEMLDRLINDSFRNKTHIPMAINCAIAEVEAMIVELEKSYNEWNLTDLQNELTELKSMLQ
jgi:hypothetical protein